MGIILATSVLGYGIASASLAKHGEVRLPEEDLVENYFLVTSALESESNNLGTESLQRFLWGLGSPLLKQAGIRYERDSDPPVIFATYINPYASRHNQYFHYPTLWQADTFAAFRYWGLALAPIWALILISLERVIRRNGEVWILFLPTACWVTFMFARGAGGNSTVSVSYVILLQIMIMLLYRLSSPRRPIDGPKLKGRSPPGSTFTRGGAGRPVK